ncbi:low affinity iron permease family protein [Desulfomonile tiedjei]|uniref:Putative small integral membrane protein n=1 Tax=Desulfomonile tiedjei (strain ATCC 49306 / DSM 6799 / DCB-1) TaxID=706587 RepID=I4C581_DESTA|nr:low affinity iron permease family protein [Desulfomonile tiedjei]AFM24722.1 putative small integral membrane protein [Desulfomonile tiedjei DSM 6799]
MNEKKSERFNELFRKFAHKCSDIAGSPWIFSAAVTIILLWGITGPFFGFSDTWQLIINTSTTIIIFLMVFLIQNTQNRESKAVQLKLDELIKSMKEARNSFIDLEELSDEELESLQKQFKRLQQRDSSDRGASKEDAERE